MQVTVTMSDREFVEFMNYREDLDKFNRKTASLEREVSMFHERLKDAIEPDPKRPGKYKIVDQEYLDDLMIMTGAAIVKE